MLSQTDAGEVQVALDSSVFRLNRFYSAAGIGFYGMPFSLVYYFQGVSAGSHNIKIRVLRYGGSRETLFGWPDADTNNALAGVL